MAACKTWQQRGALRHTQHHRDATIIVMAQVNNSKELPEKAEIATDARTLVQRAFKASLATLDSATGCPYASLITVATDASGAPIFLISTLARHTRNLVEDPRASILFDGTGDLADPLQGARVTLHGRAETVSGEAVKQRFLSSHPEAGFYVDFEDFVFWRLVLEGAHFIGGFGRIVDLEPADLLDPSRGAEA
jgi:hypothetical protein